MTCSDMAFSAQPSLKMAKDELKSTAGNWKGTDEVAETFKESFVS
jgi:hypothetical protein